MKAYFLVSPYLSDIQKGIQVSHCIAEMGSTAMKQMLSYKEDRMKLADEFDEWASKHKTMVVLNYGFNKVIVEFLWNALYNSKEVFYDRFFERELNDLQTIGFILSNHDCDRIGKFRADRKFKVSRKLGEHEEFWDVDDRGLMNKRDWTKALYEQDPFIEIEWDDFLRIVSILHPA